MKQFRERCRNALHFLKHERAELAKDAVFFSDYEKLKEYDNAIGLISGFTKLTPRPKDCPLCGQEMFTMAHCEAERFDGGGEKDPGKIEIFDAWFCYGCGYSFTNLGEQYFG